MMKKGLICVIYFFLHCYINLYAQVTNGGWVDTYQFALSESDKTQLEKGNEVRLKFEEFRPGLKFEGWLRVIPTSNKGKYKFVEIGNWKKEFEFKRSNSNKGIAKVEMRLDTLGNIINSKSFEKQYNQDQFVLIEELTLVEEKVNGKTYYYNLVKSYYTTGELWVEGYKRLLDFDIPKSYVDRKNVPAKYEKQFEKSGKLKKEKIYALKE